MGSTGVLLCILGRDWRGLFGVLCWCCLLLMTGGFLALTCTVAVWQEDHTCTGFFLVEEAVFCFQQSNLFSPEVGGKLSGRQGSHYTPSIGEWICVPFPPFLVASCANLSMYSWVQSSALYFLLSVSRVRAFCWWGARFPSHFQEQQWKSECLSDRCPCHLFHGEVQALLGGFTFSSLCCLLSRWGLNWNNAGKFLRLGGSKFQTDGTSIKLKERSSSNFRFCCGILSSLSFKITESKIGGRCRRMKTDCEIQRLKKKNLQNCCRPESGS